MQDCLAVTGTDGPVALWLIAIAVVAIVVGALVARRHKLSRGAATLMGLFLVAGLVMASQLGAAPSASAQSQDCAPSPSAPASPSAPESGSSSSGDSTAPTVSPTTSTSAVPTTTSPSTTAPTTTAPTTTEPTETTTTGPTTPTSTEPSTTVPTTPTTSEPPSCTAVNDKSLTRDTDGDGVVDRCDLDSDNDGILDSEEDLDHNDRFEDDDVDGVFGPVAVLGDGVSSYRDLDSDNDGVLDLFEGRTLTEEQIFAWDTDVNGIFDSGLSYGSNGILDELETSLDSGVLKASVAPLRNDDGDDKANFVDLNSNGVDFDLYRYGYQDLDDLGSGFISRLSDSDGDGIQSVVDTDLVNRGAPNSPVFAEAV